MTNRQIVVASLPQGALEPSHFELQDAEMPTPQDGEVLLRTILMSIDAANRSWMQGATYRDAVQAGDPMPTYAICEVVESRSSRCAVGDIVAVESVWADYVTRPAHKTQKLPRVAPLSHLLSVYGIAGKTAFHGLLSVGQPLAGETIVVSAAAGSVGSYVGQIGKALGCRVVGIAGGAAKCSHVVDTLGFDACVDYQAGGVFKALRAACPDGVDVYFDNVGGAVLETTLALMNERGRVVCCGAISQYDTTTPSGPRNLPGMVVVKRLRMEGFIVMDFAHDDAKATRALQTWVSSGQITVTEDIVEGLENAPSALIGLLNGDNTGKRMVRVGPDPA
ncbi:NADP-dependent oxidoreductase [uncultured Tateyamaria sp.]|uniref:NADP-dependent oxidoreductase n=1 Tax=uncultured Tateyamaria sp. TaxID=455651 RepID=UPI00261FC3CF|nr:NADP-dependent oxidoreductase [uncultured Tateyamaria sp.]